MRFALTTLIIACLFPAARAQDYPARPVRMVVPIGPGGGTDILARQVAAKLSERLRQPVVVENRPGAGSLVGTDHVAKSPADGYTLLVGGIFNMVMNQALLKNLPYDAARDFVPLGYLSAYPFVLVARVDLPAADLAQFVQFARRQAGRLNYGSAGLGTLQHVWGTILFKSLGLDLVHVPFKAAPAAHQEMLAGRLDVMFDNLSAVKPHLQAGRLKAYAVSSAQRSAQLPTVPTVRETGVADFEGESWFGVFAPRGIPPQAAAVMSGALAVVVRDAEFVARVDADGGRVLSLAPASYDAFLQGEIRRWTALVGAYGVSAE